MFVHVRVWFNRKLYRLNLQGSARNKISNIPQCTLPPRPVYQTLFSDSSRVWLRDYFSCVAWNSFAPLDCGAHS